MVALYVPAARPLVLTVTVRVARVVSDWLAGETVNQVALSEAVSVALYVGVLVKVSVCFCGFVPCLALKVNELGRTTWDAKLSEVSPRQRNAEIPITCQNQGVTEVVR
jgi:hypothetical protein